MSIAISAASQFFSEYQSIEANEKKKGIEKLFSPVKVYKFKNENLDDIDSLVKEAFKQFKTYNNENDPDQENRKVLATFLLDSIELEREYSSFFQKMLQLFYFIFDIETEAEKVTEYFLYPEFHNLYDELERPEIKRSDFINSCSQLKLESSNDPNKICALSLQFILGTGGTKQCELGIVVEKSYLTPCAYIHAKIKDENKKNIETEKKVSELLDGAYAKDKNAKENIVTLTFISQENDIVNFISPYCNKGELYKNFIKDRSIKNISYENRKLMFFQLICGLNTLHELGIYHMDIKPHNILVHIEKDGEIRVKITDFDLACFADSSEEEKKDLRGTPRYVDVDYINYNLFYANRLDLADVWSMGLVGYELLPCRSPPWFFSDEIGSYPQRNYINTPWFVPAPADDHYQIYIRDNMLTDCKKRKRIADVKKDWEAIVP